MKILYFHQHFTTPKGAGGTRSYEMAKRLIARGHSVTLVCGNYNGGATGLSAPFVHGVRRGFVDGIDVIEFDLAYSNSDHFIKRSLTFLKYAFRSLKLVFTENYNLIFATTTPLTAGIPGIMGRWFRGKPFVFEVRDLWPELPKTMGVITNPIVLLAMSLLEWLSYRSANRLIGLSPGIVDGIVKRGISRNKITLIPNGCDTYIFSSGTGAWRPQDVSPNDLLAVFAGTHGIANGLDAVLDAAFELKQRNHSKIKFVLVGQGKLKPQLQLRAKQENLENVIFLPPIDKVKLAGLLAGADIGLQILANIPAFYYGTSPNKFFDYIASGIPVLNNYPGWLSEMILKNDCGFSVAPENPILFANTLEIAATNREELRKKGRNALALANSQFNREDLANQFVDWLECTEQS